MNNRLLKKIWIIGMIPFFILTASCGKESVSFSSVSESLTESEKEAVSVSEEEEIGLTVSSDFELSDHFTTDEVMQKYTEYLANVISDDETKESVRYTLAYVNSDSIPELIYMEGNFKAAGVHVCICDGDGKVSDIGEFGEYGNMAYIPKTGKILAFYMNQGTYFIDFYVLKGLSLIADTYFEIDEAMLDSETDHYYVDGDEVSEEAYYEKYYAMNSNTYSYINYDHALSYSQTDDVLRVLTEYALTDTLPAIIDLKTNCPEYIGNWSVNGMTTTEGTAYSDKETADISGMFYISETGTVHVDITYGENNIADSFMPINYKGKDGPSESPVSIGFSNEDLTRDYRMYMNEDGDIEVALSDFSGLFGDNYTCYLLLKKVTEE